MRFSFEGTDYLLQFQYEKDQKEAGKKPLMAPNVTKCLLYCGDSGCHVTDMVQVNRDITNRGETTKIAGTPIFGKTVRSATEQHDKDKARKLSLTRLLQDHTSWWVNEDRAKQFRTAAWAAYFNRKGVVIKPITKKCGVCGRKVKPALTAADESPHALAVAKGAKMTIRGRKASAIRQLQKVGRLKRKKKKELA